MMVTAIIPISATTLSERTFHPMAKGNTLYVGGSGPNNYTKIQDAVDNSSDGDTVFVYDDSSPYYEHITIDTSITVRGENKLTTIIDSSYGLETSFQINTDYVTITGFTFQNSGCGVYIGGPHKIASHNTVKDNRFLNTHMGVVMFYGDTQILQFTKYGYNIIADNLIVGPKYMGIYAVEGRNNQIIGNTISNVEPTPNYGMGIYLIAGAYNNISFNNITDNGVYGIDMYITYDNLVYRNNIKNNPRGLFMEWVSFDTIKQNNFIGNTKNVLVHQSLMYMINSTLSQHHPLLPVRWAENYWDEPRTQPYRIPTLFDFYDFVYIISGGQKSFLNLIRFDRHPASQPYDISQGMVG